MHSDAPLAPPPSALAVDPYAPPAAPVAVPTERVAATRFYVVSTTKFWVLDVATLGLYGFFWVYLQWAAIKRATRGDEWPVMRALFAVFFMHSLTAEIDQVLRRGGIARDWSPAGLATGAVVAIIAGRLLERMPGDVLGELAVLALGFGAIALVGLCKWRIQLAANAACGDPEGRANARFGAANIVWLALFGVIWMLVLLGLALPQE